MWVDGDRREGLRGPRGWARAASGEEGTAQGPQAETGAPFSCGRATAAECFRFRSYTHPPNRSLEGGRVGVQEGRGCPEPQVPASLPSLPTGFPWAAKPSLGWSQSLPRGVDSTLVAGTSAVLGRSDLGAGVPACLGSGGFGARSPLQHRPSLSVSGRWRGGAGPARPCGRAAPWRQAGPAGGTGRRLRRQGGPGRGGAAQAPAPSRPTAAERRSARERRAARAGAFATLPASRARFPAPRLTRLRFRPPSAGGPRREWASGGDGGSSPNAGMSLFDLFRGFFGFSGPRR